MKLRTAFWILIPLSLIEFLVTGSHLISEESARRSVRGREMIMDNLRRFHGGLEPLQFIPKEHPQFKHLPDFVLHHLANDFMNRSESNCFYSSCRGINQVRAIMINNRLLNFSKYYLFEEQWMNNLMYAIIQDHFPENMSLTSNDIHDYLELMTLKYISEDFSELLKSIPIHLIHAIMTFFHETVYGPGQIVPSAPYYEVWAEYISYKITGFRLPKTVDYFSELPSGSCLEYVRYFRYMLEPRTRKEKEQFINTMEKGKRKFSHVINFEWNFQGYLPDDEAKLLLEKLGRHEIYSEHILNRILLTEAVDEHINRISRLKIFGLCYKRAELVGPFLEKFRRYLNRRAGHALEEPVNNCESYIMTRDLNNPFELDELQTFDDFEPWSIFRLIVEKDLPYLIKMDMLSKLVRSGLVPLNLKEPGSTAEESALQKLATGRIHLYFELVFYEFPKFVNLENLDFRRLDLSTRNFIFTTRFYENNPLALVLYQATANDIASLSKINLNVAYLIDCDYGHDISVPFRVGTTLTFRQILRIIGNDRLNEAFGLNSLQDFEESDEQISSYKIISMRDFLNDPNSIVV